MTGFELRGVSAGYRPGRKALRDLDLTLSRGRAIALLGENGSGKSTLLKLLAGVLEPSAGALTLDRRPLSAIPRRERAQLVSYLPQSFEPFFPASAREIVLLGRTPHLGVFGSPTAKDHAIVERALSEVDAGGLASADIREMSGGERQRVYLARVLAGEAGVLLLDEPTGNLDPRHRLLVVDVIRRRIAEGGTVVFSTHELDIAALAADEATLLKGGAAQASGPIADTLTGSRLSALFDVAALVSFSSSGRPVISLEAKR